MFHFKALTSLFICTSIALCAYISRGLLTPPPQRKLALLVGINAYKYPDKVPTLRGCLNDVRDVENLLLSERYGFLKKDIFVLTDQQATHENIRKEFVEHLINQAKPGDIVFFYYSGHGSRMEDPKEIDGWDNTIVPYDSRDDEKKVSDITDKELNGLLRELSKKTDKITTVLDSCFSGTGFKGSNRSRRAPDDLRFGNSPPSLPQDAERARDVIPSGSGFYTRDVRYVLLAGSRSDQVSFEYFKNGEDHGAFTYFLLQELRRPTNRLTYRDVMERTTAAVMEVYPNQTPQIEGANADNAIFGDESIVPQRYVQVFPESANRVRIAGGLAMGFTRGSIFDVYPPGSRDFSPSARPIATLELEEVKVGESSGKIMKIVKGLQVPPASRAVERVHQYDNARTRIFYEGLLNSPILQYVKDEIDQLPGQPVESVSTKEAAQIFLKEQLNTANERNEILTLGADGALLGSPLDASEPSVVGHVTKRVAEWAQWFGVQAIHNENSTGKLSLLLQPDPANSGTASGVFAEGSNPNLLVGDKFSLTITNKSRRDIFVYVLDLTNNGRIDLLYPEDNGVQPLHGNTSYKLQNLSAGIGDESRTRALDVIKVIATTKPVPIEYLQQGAIKGKAPDGAPDPITQLLFSAFQGRREILRTVVDEWDSSQIVVGVSRSGNEHR